MRDVESQLRDYWSGLIANHPVPSAAALIDPERVVDAESSPDRAGEPISANGTTPVVGQDNEILVELDYRPETKEHTMSTKQWLLVGVAAALVLIAGIVAISVQDDEAGQVDSVNTPEQPTNTTLAPTTSAAPTTVTTETTLPPPIETVEVPFHLLDSAIPTNQFTCTTAAQSFEVMFVNESGVSTVVVAATEDAFNLVATEPDPVTNATCTNVVAAADGEPAVLYTALLDVPAANTYQSIGVKYPGDQFETIFEMVPRAEAEAGLYVEFSDDDGYRVIGPSEVEALQLAG